MRGANLNSYEQIDWDAAWWCWLAIMIWTLTLAYDCAAARLAATVQPTPIIVDMFLSPDGPAFQL
jgi:hypothetical protein